jgi:hypothetical protein
MVVTSAQILSVDANYVTVFNQNKNRNVKVWLPSVISRLPRVDDYIVYDIDDVDYENGSFIAYYGETPIKVASFSHTHQMMSDTTINGMPGLDTSTKENLRNLETGGVHE